MDRSEKGQVQESGPTLELGDSERNLYHIKVYEGNWDG